jgi:uncharacterized membrane protein
MHKFKIADEQLIYAKVINAGRAIGLAGLIITFIIYTLGIIPPKIPLNEISKYWSLSTKDYIAKTAIPTGWSWVRMLNHSDFMNFLPIVLLTCITFISYIAIIPVYLRKKDKLYAWIAAAEIFILLLAASGILRTIGH